MPDIRNYIQDHPRYSVSGQTERLGAGELYVENRAGTVIDALIRSVRKGSIVQVDELFLLAPIRKGYGPARRKRAMADRIDAIKERGGIIRERSSGAQSNKAGFSAAIVRATEMISFGGRGAPGRSRPGRPGIELTQHEREAVESIWQSRRYANDDERVTAIAKRIGKKIKRGWLWSHLGSPQKPADKS